MSTVENDYIKNLSEFKLFEGVSEEGLRLLLPALSKKTFKQGDHLTRFDSMDNHVYFILNGIVDVRITHLAKHAEETVYQLKENDTVGEFLIARLGRRTASCIAYCDVDVLIADGQEISRIAQTNSELGMHLFRNLSIILCERLHDNNMYVRQVLSSGWMV